MSEPSLAVVTGASSGIGAIYADRLAKRGHDLLLVARDQTRLDTLADRLRRETGVSVDVLRADLTAPADLAAVEARIRGAKNLGILVNNAGAASPGGFSAPDLEPLYALVDLNVGALTRLAGAAVQNWLGRGAQGSLINLGSVVGFAPTMLPGVYGATKAYVLALSQALQSELGPRGIYVQALLPAGTKTEIWERSGRSVNDGFMNVEELVDAALVGFDRREPVTIPPLKDASFFDKLQAANMAVMQDLDQAQAAARYRSAAEAA
ncbi:SDR family oxidoreductase [Beijerinckia sp. L45]|uniref:SDR family NAD(P)-dependent oxidoreductase n=1 Tax=Beijerinckia sp. L45 TaxID=1641855 RepID=UPI00131BE694|nr:SDR family NAD(P)-dependent oxidoreductase [Beijerinckia sp. L45]